MTTQTTKLESWSHQTLRAPELHHITNMSEQLETSSSYKMEQRLAPVTWQPPRSVHKQSWAPRQLVRRLLSSCDQSGITVMWLRSCNYNSGWKHCDCYPHPLNGPQLHRWAEAKEARVTDIWTQSAMGIQRNSLTLSGEEQASPL